jgi:hypothetical protein
MALSGYLVSETTASPFFAAFARAPSMGFFENGASAATIATVSGRGVCFEAVSKNPSVRAEFGSVPVGIMAKKRSYSKSMLTPRPIRPTRNFPFAIASGIAGLIELLPYPPSSRSTFSSDRSFS